MFAWRDQYLSFNGTGDPYWSNVSLLTNFESPQDCFVDSSTNNFPITIFGDSRPNLTTPFTGVGGSLYFDGSGDYISAPDSSGYYFTGDFTVEAWVYFTTQNTTRCVVGQWPGVIATNCAWSMDVHSTNNLYFGYGIGSTNAYATSTLNVPINQWVHCAVTRSGTSIRMFVNGTASSPVTVSGSLNDSTGALNIGRKGDNSNYCVGLISNCRVVKGTALYTANFTPSTTPLTAVSGTSILVNATNQGYPGNTLFWDQSKNAFTVTATNNPRYSGLSPFGNTYPGSISLTSASTQYLTVATNAAFTYATGDFTIECWVRLNTVGATQYVIDQRNSGTANAVIPTIYINSSNNVIYFVSNAAQITGTQTLTTGVWYNITVCRSGTSTKLFVNGTQDGSTYSDSNNYAASRVTIGGQGDTVGNTLNGYISNVRLSKGFAYYTSNFTPSSIPLTTSTTYTSLFVAGTYAGIQDLSTYGQLITNVSGSYISTQQKQFGTQSFFIAAATYMTVTDNASLRFGTGDFTIEGWVYRNSAGVLNSIIGKGATTPTGWLLQINASNQLVWYSDSTALKTSTTTIGATTWTYFAITRTGTTAYMFINGTLEGSSFTDNGNYNQTNNMVIGCDRSGANSLVGYIDDLRLTTGVCRYTASFTAPTATFPTS